MGHALPAMTLQQHLQGLYVITDPVLTPAQNIEGKVEQALKGGARIVQYRDKTSDRAHKIRQAKSLLQLCNQYHALLMINDDVDLCLDVEAHGVHLGLEDEPLQQARERLGPHKIIGATCHGDTHRALQAVASTADYVAFGRFYPSKTKPEAPPARLDQIAPLLPQLPVPAVAIGGITLDNAKPLIEAGFSMLAVIQDVFGHNDITTRARAFCQLFSMAQTD